MVNLDDLTYDTPPDDVAKALFAELKRRGYGRDESIAVVSTGLQESGLRMISHPTRDWFGYFQQDTSYPNRRSPVGNAMGFLDRLAVQLAKPGASPDIWKNIFWLQQGPNHPSADYAYSVGRKAYLTEIQSKIDRATSLYDEFTGGPTVGFRGDPVWLEDVLREALGNRLVVEPGWKERGAGGVMGDIWGVMIHHTGNRNERVEVIRDGVQQPGGWLPGPLSQCLIKPDGTCHLIAVGPCNHAGSGSYGSLTNGNRDSIGFECAWPTIKANGTYDPAERWPDAQILTMRDATAAVIKRLGYRGDRVCGHKEYAKPAGRKWDPGNIDMNWFRGEVNKWLDGAFAPKPTEPPVTEPPISPPVVIPGPVLPPGLPQTDRQLLVEIWHQLRGVEGNGWPQLGGLTPVDYLGHLDKRLDAIEAKLDRLLEGGTDA